MSDGMVPEEFLAAIQKGGTYLVIATRWRVLEHAGRILVEMGARVQMGIGIATWPSGGKAHLIPIDGRDVERLHGFRIDGVWFIEAGDDARIPGEVIGYVFTLATGPEFAHWWSNW